MEWLLSLDNTKEVLLSVSISPHCLNCGVFSSCSPNHYLAGFFPPCTQYQHSEKQFTYYSHFCHFSHLGSIRSHPSCWSEVSHSVPELQLPWPLKGLACYTKVDKTKSAWKSNTRTSLHFLQNEYNPLVNLEFHMPYWEHKALFHP